MPIIRGIVRGAIYGLIGGLLILGVLYLLKG